MRSRLVFAFLGLLGSLIFACSGKNSATPCPPGQSFACSCTGTKTCTQGCATAADCRTGETCDGTHRCVAQPCGSCPAHFVCTSGACQRQTCTSDASCGSGYCVEGLCYDTLGMCSFLPG